MIANIENAFKFVFKDKGWVVKVLIGGAILIIPIVQFITFGYALKVLKDAKEGNPAVLPEWGDWAALFKNGFIVFAVGLAYGLIIFVFWFVTTLINLIPVIGCLGFLFFPVMIILLFLLAPAINISLCKYIDKGTFQDALNLKEVFEEFKSKISDYLIVTLISVGISFFASMAFCFAPFIYFWLWIIIARMFGEIYGTRPTQIGA